MTSQRVFALVDCNNFYASCERIFQPKFYHKPIVILSNNDGCIVARSNEAKDLGIPMAAPFHQYRKIIEQNGVEVFSSNYSFYGDMSSRVMESLQMMVADIEIYSIDEAFLRLDNLLKGDIFGFCVEIRNNIQKWLSLPTSIGIAPTKTLAKIANDLAKKRSRKSIKNFLENFDYSRGAEHVFDLRDQDLRREILAKTEVGEIWGISRQTSSKLNRIGIFSALDLHDADSKLVRKILGVVGERIVYELRGISCLDLDEVAPRKNIMSSRSFGRKVTAKEELIEAIANYATRAHEKLISQKSLTRAIYVYIRTNPFALKDEQYRGSVVKSFLQATDSLSEIIQSAVAAVEEIYRPNFNYKKAGIILLDLLPNSHLQESILVEVDEAKRVQRNKVEAAMRSINSKLGRNSIFYSILGTRRDWSMRCSKRSPSYTTNIAEIPLVK